MKRELKNILIEYGVYGEENLNEAVDKILILLGVVGQSEQLVCDCGNSSMTWYGNDDDKIWFCFNCKKEAK